MTYRCTGTIHGPVGDCARPIAGALVCYGYLDHEEARPLHVSMGKPVPMLFPVCKRHKAALLDWAEHLWGMIADAMFVSPEGIPAVVRHFEMDPTPLVLAPDPAQAVGIQVG
jgi:hypothetical protein